jgi:hypothetical protein
MGEPTKLVILEKVVEVLQRENLMGNAQDIGKSLLDGLKDLEQHYPQLVICMFLSKFLTETSKGTKCAGSGNTLQLRYAEWAGERSFCGNCNWPRPSHWGLRRCDNQVPKILSST